MYTELPIVPVKVGLSQFLSSNPTSLFLNKKSEVLGLSFNSIIFLLYIRVYSYLDGYYFIIRLRSGRRLEFLNNTLETETGKSAISTLNTIIVVQFKKKLNRYVKLDFSVPSPLPLYL